MDTTKSDNIHAFQVQWDKRKNRSRLVVRPAQNAKPKS
jgi:hypothetical protein